MHQLDAEGVEAFRMYPCLYLSRDYSPHFAARFSHQVQQPSLYQEVLDVYLQRKGALIDGIALASSCLLIHREWCLALGGFRDEFKGHGCEDFDLIHRLAAFYPVGARPADYAVDIKCSFPAGYEGFRRYFSYYAIPHLFTGQFLLHQWHPRPFIHSYHRRKQGNETLFADILQSRELSLPAFSGGHLPSEAISQLFDTKPSIERPPLPALDQFLRVQMSNHGFVPELCPGLFYAPLVRLKFSDRLWRKLRKLCSNPKGFFRDIKR